MTKLNPATVKELHGRIANLGALGDRFITLEEGDAPERKGPLALGEKSNKLYLLGAIVSETERLLFSDFYPDDVSGSQICKLLDEYDGKPLELIINCPGGSVYEGAVIYERLKELAESGVEIKAFVAGVAASAATYVMYGAEKVEMGEMATLFVHPPQAFLMGGAGSLQLRELAKTLDGMETQLLDLYKGARGVDLRKELHAQADIGEGTYYTADEALEAGLVDGVRKAKAKGGRKDVKQMALLLSDYELADEKDPSAFDAAAAARKRADEETALGLWRAS